MSGEPKLCFACAMFVPSHAEFFNIFEENDEENNTAVNKL